MNNLKYMSLLFFVTLSITTYSQSVINQSKFGFKTLNFTKSKHSLHLYNKTSGMYDNYLIKDDNNSYTFSNSNMVFEQKSNILIDLFYGNNSLMESGFLQNNPLLQKHYFQPNSKTRQIRDSFNPYGASNINEALIIGTLGWLFN